MKTLLFTLALSMITPVLSAHANCELETPIKLSELSGEAFTDVTVESLLNWDSEDRFESSDKLELEIMGGSDILKKGMVLGALIRIAGSDDAIGPLNASEELIRRYVYKEWQDAADTNLHMVYKLDHLEEGRSITSMSDVVVVGDEIRSIEITERSGDDFNFYCVTRASR